MTTATDITDTTALLEPWLTHRADCAPAECTCGLRDTLRALRGEEAFQTITVQTSPVRFERPATFHPRLGESSRPPKQDAIHITLAPGQRRVVRIHGQLTLLHRP